MNSRFYQARNRKLCGLYSAMALMITAPWYAAANPPGVEAKQDLSLEAIFASDTFSNRLPKDIRWLSGSQGFTYIDPETGALMLQDVSDTAQAKRSNGWPGEPAVLVDPASASASQTTQSAQWTADHRFALISSSAKTTWDGYTESAYQVYDTRHDSWRSVGDGSEQIRQAHLSPSGRHLAYVHHNNLYLEDLASGESTALTQSGSDAIFNGIFDYGSSEFGATRAWHWSPDGKTIAFWQLDASQVPEFPLIDELGNYSKTRSFHYPNAGGPHAINRIGVYSLEQRTTRWLRTETKPDDYLPTMHWGSEGRFLFVQHLTRNQKQLRLLRFDLKDEGFDVVLTDTDPAWIDITDDFRSLAGGDDFLWTSERSGYRHIYRYKQGKLSPLTRGNWSVDRLIGVAGSEPAIYFYAKKDSLIDQHVYRVPLSGGEVERVTHKPGWHEWQLSPDGQYALTRHSDAKTPPVMQVRKLAQEGSGQADKPSAVIADNRIPGMEDFAMTHTEFVQFDTSDGVRLNGYFIKPPDFDPARRYPLIAYAYGNAGSQIVVNRWGTQRGPTQDLWHRYLAQKGYVVFAMDNRTTTGRGKAAKNLTYGHYGKYAVSDQLQAVDYLKSLPWVDSERLGFWGWSGGGYLAAALMTKGAPHFKVGVSVAPVIDLTRYQAVGVERWMGTPAENPSGYAAVNLMNDADKLQGKLLLMHGSGDENVKFAFTLQFADSLIRANKQFDMMVYPNQRHTISDARLHVFSTITRYFEDHL